MKFSKHNNPNNRHRFYDPIVKDYAKEREMQEAFDRLPKGETIDDGTCGFQDSKAK